MKWAQEYDILPETKEIFAFGEIDLDFYTKLMRNISILKAGSMSIYLTSAGGDPSLALGLYDRIVALPKDVHIYVYGEVCSAAAIILQAADRRYMSNNSLLMMHDIMLEDVSGNPKSLSNLLDITQHQTDKILDILAHRSTLSRQQLKNKLCTDWYLNTEEALDYGFVDERC